LVSNYNIHEVPADIHKNFEKETGVNWVNPPKVKAETIYNFESGGVDGSKFEVDEESAKIKSQLLSNIDSQSQEVDHSIGRDVRTSFFGGKRPQEHASSYLNLVQEAESKGHADVMFFDAETIGPKPTEAKPGQFSPLEVTFAEGRMKAAGGFETTGKQENLVMSLPNQTENLVNDWLKQAESGQQVLEDFKQRSLVDLMNYSDGVEIKDGRVISHAHSDGKSIPGLAHLIREQHGTLNFARDNIQVQVGDETININPKQKVKEGVRNLKKHGLNPQEAAREITEIYGNNAHKTFMGFNSAQFDIKGFSRFLTDTGADPATPDKHLDFYQLLTTTVESPKHLEKIVGSDVFDSSVNLGSRGKMSLENLVPNVLGKDVQELHLSETDTFQMAGVASEIEPNFRDHLRDTISKSQQKTSEEVPDSGYKLDLTPLKKKDKLVSTGYTTHAPIEDLDNYEVIDGVPVPKDSKLKPEGYTKTKTGTEISTGSAYDMVVRDGEVVTDQTSIIKSKEVYSLEEQYETTIGDKKMHGIRLKNESSGEDVYINRFNQKELQKVIQENFEFGGKYSADKLNQINQDKLDDLSRSRFRKIVDGRQGGGKFTLDKMLEGLGELEIETDEQGRIIGDGVLDQDGNFVKTIPTADLKKVDGIGGTLHKRIEEKVGTQIGNISEEELIQIDGINKVKAGDILNHLSKKGAGVVEDRDEALNLVSDYMENNRERFEKAFTLEGVGKDKSKDVFLDSYYRDFSRLSYKLGREKNFWENLQKQVETKFSDSNSFSERIKQDMAIKTVYENAIEETGIDIEEHKIALDEKEYATSIKIGKEERHIPLGDVEKTQSALLRSIGGHAKDSKGRVDEEYKRKKLKGILKSGDIKGIIGAQQVGEYIDRVDEGYYDAVQDISRELNKKENLEKIGKEVKVESLEGVQALNHQDVSSITDNIADKVNQVDFAIKNKTGTAPKFNQSVNQVLEGLDENLNKLYKDVGLKQTPTSMESQLKTFIQDLTKQMSYSDKDIGMKGFFNMQAENPTVSLAMFDQTGGKNRHFHTEGIEELKEKKGVAMMHVPLVSEKGTIKYGNEEKIAPAAFLDRFVTGAKEGQGYETWAENYKEFAGYGNVVGKTKKGDELVLHSSFDKVLLSLRQQTNKMREAVDAGNWAEVEKEAHKGVLKGLQDLSSTTPYVQDEAFGQAIHTEYDDLKRAHLGIQGVFNPINLRHGEKGMRSLSDPTKSVAQQEGILPAQQALKSLSNQLEIDVASNVDNILEDAKIFDENVAGKAYNWAGGRGEHFINRFMLPLKDVREEFSFGFMNNPGRPNMVQSYNVRNLTDHFLSNEIEGQDYRDTSLLFGSEEELDMSKNAFSARMKMMDSYEIATTLEKKRDELIQKQKDGSLSKKEEKTLSKIEDMLKNPEKMPTVAQDQLLYDESLKDKMYSTKKGVIELDKMDDIELKDEVKKRIEEGEKYQLKHGEHFYDYTKRGTGEKAKGYYDKKKKTAITGITETKDKMLLETEEQFSVMDGTKAFFGSEKGTIGHVDSDILDVLTEDVKGKGKVDFIANPDFVSHKAYGDIASSYVKDAMMQAKYSEKVNEQKIKEISQAVSEIFGLDGVKVDADTNAITYSNKGLLDALTSEKGIKPEDITKLFDQLQGIDGIELDEKVLTNQVVFSDVSESLYSSPMFDLRSDDGLKPKKRGAKIGPRELGKLKSQGLDKTSEVLRRSIEETDPEKKKKLFETFSDEGLALKHLHFPDEFADEFKGVESKNIKDFRDLINTTDESIKQKKGIFSEKDLKKTILDPDQDGFFLELPDEVEVHYKDKRGKLVPEGDVRIDKVYMPKLHLEPDGKHEQHAKDKIAQKRAEVFEYAKKWKKSQDVGIDLEGLSQEEKEKALKDKGYMMPGKAKEMLEKSIVDYQKALADDLYGSKGRLFDKKATSRLKGSGMKLLKTKNPIADLDPSMFEGEAGAETLKSIDKHLKDMYSGKDLEQARSKLDQVIKTTKSVGKQDVNVAHISKEAASELIGVDTKHIDEALKGEEITLGSGEEAQKAKNMIKEMTSEEGHFATIGRYPTNYAHSFNLGKVKIDEKLEGTNEMYVTDSLIQKMYGDSDGDLGSINLLDYSPEEKSKLQEEYMKEKRLIEDMIKDKEGKIKDGYAEDLAKLLGSSSPLDQLRQGEGFDKKINPYVGETAQKAIFKSKATNPALTGYTYNIAEKVRQMGMATYDDPEQLMKVNEVAGKLSEIPISAKHAMSLIEDDKNIDDIIVNTLKGIQNKDIEGAIGEAEALDKAGGKLSLDKEDLGFIQNIFDRSEAIGKGQDIPELKTFLSKQVADDPHALRELVKSDLDITKSVTPNMAEQVHHMAGEQIDDYYKGREKNIEQIKNALGTEKTEALNELDEAERLKDKRKKLSLEGAKNASDTMTAGAGKFGLLKGAAIAGAGYAAANMVSTDPLPMDGGNQPGLSPRNNQQEPQGHISEETVNGFEVNISGQVGSTIGKEPEELAGAAAQVAQQYGQGGVNVNINSNDNREEIEQGWIEEQMLKLI